MQIVIDIEKETYNEIKEGFYDRNSRKMAIAIRNGTPLPDGAEILTKEAYSDLCLRAAGIKSEDLKEYVYPDDIATIFSLISNPNTEDK